LVQVLVPAEDDLLPHVQLLVLFVVERAVSVPVELSVDFLHVLGQHDDFAVGHDVPDLEHAAHHLLDVVFRDVAFVAVVQQLERVQRLLSNGSHR